MRPTRRQLALAACIFSGWASISAANDATTHFDLSNGLHVILRPVRGAQQTAVVTLFDLGGDHDPPGTSGLAHLVEHVYVTAAAGETPARTADEFARAYPLGWNAQTGDDYTVFATVVEPPQLEAELQHHAQRMGALVITQDDLRRELPRIELELANMFERMPALAATNLGRERVRPTLLEGRKGGRIEDLNHVLPDQLQSRWQKYYKPKSATLVVAGDIDRAVVRRSIESTFASLPPGEEPPPAQASPAAAVPIAAQTIAVEPIQPTLRSTAALSFRAPGPGSRDYAPFLCVVTRLLVASHPGGAAPQPAAPSLRYSFLDDPHVISVVSDLEDAETAEQAAARLRAFVDKTLSAGWSPHERLIAKQQLAFFYETMPMPDHALTQNVYGVSFGAGRRHQMNLDGKTLAAQLDRVQSADIRRVARKYFASEGGAMTTVMVQP